MYYLNMSTLKICDICKKGINDKGIPIWVYPSNHYCNKCWSDKKSWPKIHKPRKI